MNLRPSGYEPDELPDCSTPRRLKKVDYSTAAVPLSLPRGITGLSSTKVLSHITNRALECPLGIAASCR